MDVGAAVAMAEGLLAEHGLPGWTVVLDRARTRAGVCRPDRRQIGLSAPLTALHSEAEVRDTVLHEIAHALVGPRHGHDATWRATARRIGCSGERTTSAPRPPGAWTGTCPAGHTVSRHRRPARVSACARCSRGFDPRHLLTWTHSGQEVLPAQLPASYRHDWERLQAAAVAVADPPLTVGSRVRIAGGGRHAGTTGRIVKRGRTRYHVQTSRGILTVPFSLAEEVRA